MIEIILFLVLMVMILILLTVSVLLYVVIQLVMGEHRLRFVASDNDKSSKSNVNFKNAEDRLPQQDIKKDKGIDGTSKIPQTIPSGITKPPRPQGGFGSKAK